MARKLDGWMARKIEEQIARRLEDNKTPIQSIEYGLSIKLDLQEFDIFYRNMQQYKKVMSQSRKNEFGDKK